jgi:hypothetical protein
MRGTLKPVDQIDASSLAVSLWLNDEDVSSARSLHVLPELRVLLGKHPGGGMEAVLLRNMLLHEVEPFSELVFPGYGVYAWQIINCLMEVHAYEGFRSDRVVGPANIPVPLVRLIDHSHAQFLRCLSNHRIVCD